MKKVNLFFIYNSLLNSEFKFYILCSIIITICICPIYSQGQNNNIPNFEKIPQQKIELKKRYLENFDIRLTDNVKIFEYGLSESEIGKSNLDRAINFLKKNSRSKYRIPFTSLKLDKQSYKNAENDFSFRFTQFHKNIPIGDNAITLNFNNINQICEIINTTFPIQSNFNTNYLISEKQAKVISCSHFYLKKIPNELSINKIIYLINNIPILAYKIITKIPKIPGRYQIIINGLSGEIIEVKDILCYATGRAKLFVLDPLYVSNKNFGGNYADNDDATNTDLESLQKLVNLLDITYDQSSQLYSLIGPNAQLITFPNDPCGQDVTSNNGDFFFTRNQYGFEATMCYYHIDDNMRYVKSIGPSAPKNWINVGPILYPNGWKFLPNCDLNPFGSFFDPSTEQMSFDNACSDNAEDPGIILHELMHAYQKWASNGAINIGKHAEGPDEGVCDYWAQSNSRKSHLYGECNKYYHSLFNWTINSFCYPGLERRTDFTHFYGDLLSVPGGPHARGQLLSSVLMKINEDIGKEKTDKMILRGLVTIIGYEPQSSWARKFYLASGFLGYSINDRCVIYNHFNRVYGLLALYNINPPGINSDIYIKDNYDDSGNEPNITTDIFYLSPDIWLRQTPGLSNSDWCQDQNAEYSADPNKKNYINVRIRARGCEPLENAKLHIYFSKASSGLQWPIHWNNYFINGVLAGNEIGNINIPLIESGKEVILQIAWNPPNPALFNDLDPSEKHHFCLLARIVSSLDPIGSEGSNVNSNTKNNNNIAWKNISVFDNTEGIISDPDTVCVYVRNTEGQDNINGNKLCINIPDRIFNNTYYEEAIVEVILEEPLRTTWINNGSMGSGFTILSNGNIRPNSDEFCLDNLSLDINETYTAKVLISPNTSTKRFSFNFIQKDASNFIAGGEFFVYNPSENPLNNLRNKFNNPIIQKNLKIENTFQENTVFEFTNVVLYNLQGKIICKYDSLNSDLIEIYKSDLLSGIYLFTGIFKGKKITRKICVVK